MIFSTSFSTNGPHRVPLAACVLAGMLIGTAAHAEWPRDKAIELIVGFAAGGGQDIMARSFAPHLEKRLPGSHIVVVNRPGASGEIAYAMVGRAKPDGYTLGVISTPGLNALPLQRKTQYEPGSVVPVARIVDDPTALVVADGARFDSLKRFVDAAREAPGTVSAGFNGVGTNGHFGSMLLERAANLRFNGIPYQGTGQSRPALLGGHVDSIFMGLGEYLEIAKDPKTKVRLLGYMSADRVKEAGNAPTFRDIGLDLVFSSERGIAAPRGLPPAIAARLADAIEQTIADPAFRDAARSQSLLLAYLPGPEWARQIDTLTARLAEIVKSMPPQK